MMKIILAGRREECVGSGGGDEVRGVEEGEIQKAIRNFQKNANMLLRPVKSVQRQTGNSAMYGNGKHVEAEEEKRSKLKNSALRRYRADDE